MMKGILSICEDHERPLRACLAMALKGREKLSAKNVQKLLKRILGDDGCSMRHPDFVRCGLVPAVFWVYCACGCGFGQRVCRKHRDYRPTCRPHAPPPPGTGTVYQQQIGRGKTSG